MTTYATPARFIQEYGLGETTQLLADEQQLLTSDLLLGALAMVFTGTPTAEEVAAANAAAARLNGKLASISNFMDGYLGAAAGTASGTLEECCVALTRCGLADDADNATERMDKCCDTWRTWLKDVAAGRVNLVAASGVPVASNSPVRTGQAVSRYNWGGFGGGL